MSDRSVLESLPVMERAADLGALPSWEDMGRILKLLSDDDRSRFLEHLIRSVWEAAEMEDLRPVYAAIMGWYAYSLFDHQGAYEDLEERLQATSEHPPSSLASLKRELGLA